MVTGIFTSTFSDYAIGSEMRDYLRILPEQDNLRSLQF